MVWHLSGKVRLLIACRDRRAGVACRNSGLDGDFAVRSDGDGDFVRRRGGFVADRLGRGEAGRHGVRAHPRRCRKPSLERLRLHDRERLRILPAEFVKAAVKKYPNQIAVSIDAREGMVSADGWTDTSEVDFITLAKEMEAIGVKYLIFTDISKDGMLSGPNLTMLDELQASVKCHIIASGGVANLKDIVNLSTLHLYGAISGKAVYTGSLDLKQAIAVAEAAEEKEKQEQE